MNEDQDTPADLATAVLRQFLASLASQGIEPGVIARLKAELEAPGPVTRSALESALFNEVPSL